jgi:hypothetical protein
VSHAAGETPETAPGAPPSGQPPRHRRRRRRRRGPPRPVVAAEGGIATAEGTPAPAESGEGPAVEITTPRAPGENTLRLRTRPPRRRRRPPGLRPISEATAAPATGDATGPEATPTNEEGAGAATPAPVGPRLGPDGQPLRRRRRRRRPPQFGGTGENAPAAEGAAEGTAPAPRDPNRPPRHRNRRPRGDRPNDRPAAEGGETAPHEARPGRDRRAGPDRGPRDGDRRRDGPTGRRDRRDRGEGRDGRGRGRGRDDREKRVERKLYNIDSVVDRGFEDIEEEAGARRVHWTIVKRTVADQITRKPMSQNYVLQRDGVDSEFPSLGAARDAVNKKIVHPEKLTLSKAEHAAQKSGR